MILIDSGQRDTRSFAAKILFAAQLTRVGYDAVIDEKTVPQTIDRNQEYEAAPFLADITQIDISGYVMIGAETVSDETVIGLRSYQLAPDLSVSAIGRFPDTQSQIGATTKISFALGHEANIIDLAELHGRQLLETSVNPLVSVGTNGPATTATLPELFVYLPQDWLEDLENLTSLSAMNFLPGFILNIVTSGKGKGLIQQSIYSGLSVFSLNEIPPLALAQRAQVAVFLGDGVPGERMAAFALEVLSGSGVLVDSTTNGAFVNCGAPALRGPTDLAGLPNFIQHTVGANLAEIGRQAHQSDWLERTSIQRLIQHLNLSSASRPLPKPTDTTARTIFLPTNGNGLGHAQRCSLIAEALPAAHPTLFAAFPSCIPLINSKSYPCMPLVQKSDDHDAPHANDLVNYLRLRQLCRPGDHLVFDGGYVFDSIYRTVMENALCATWIRRGLWRAGQITQTALGREKVFDQVIVPQEAFDELNTAYTHGPTVHQVGPIVQNVLPAPDDAPNLKEKLEKKFHRRFDQLVVSMLGGGVASDRSAQLHALCAILEQRPNCLHLIVVWPGSRISAGLQGWKNTQIVKTKHALQLCLAADLVISAAGYNSFHEILYHQMPAIFIPQSAPFMDDQEKRARSASERGLAATVLANEILILEREVVAFLDTEKSATIRQKLGKTVLPERGNKKAAELICAMGAK
ncbi:MAG: hypothetical protein KUG69_10580 [Marinosulfonomonas sp.]|nr:hypothetical protein [Marinosulfonomonas sp.]